MAAGGGARAPRGESARSRALLWPARRLATATPRLVLPLIVAISSGAAAGLAAGPPAQAEAASGAHLPTLTGLTPASGIVGTTVTLTGTYLSKQTAVQFGTVRATSVTVKSADKLLAVAPPGKGTVDVSVTTPSGTSNAEPFTYDVPTVTSISPKSGHPGTLITLKGSGFSQTAEVLFEGQAVNGATVGSTKAITFSLPTLATLKKKTPESVVVHTPAGTSAGVTFTYVPFARLKVTTTSLPEFVSTQEPSYGPVTLTASGGRLHPGRPGLPHHDHQHRRVHIHLLRPNHRRADHPCHRHRHRSRPLVGLRHPRGPLRHKDNRRHRGVARHRRGDRRHPHLQRHGHRRQGGHHHPVGDGPDHPGSVHRDNLGSGACLPRHSL